MDIRIEISDADVEFVESQLVGTVSEWLQSALDGKIANCRKRADPIAVALADKERAEQRAREDVVRVEAAAAEALREEKAKRRDVESTLAALAKENQVLNDRLK